MCLLHDLLTKFSVLSLLPYECSVSVIHVIAHIALCLHMKIILLPEEGNLLHQIRCMIVIKSLLALPCIYEKDGLIIRQTDEIVIPQTSRKFPYFIDSPAFTHFLHKGLCTAVMPSVIEVHRKTHRITSDYVTFNLSLEKLSASDVKGRIILFHILEGIVNTASSARGEDINRLVFKTGAFNECVYRTR